MSDLSFTEVGEILRLLQGVDGTHVELEWGDLRLQVRRGGTVDDVASEASTSAPLAPPSPEKADGAARPLPPSADQHAVQTDRTDTSGTDIPAHWIAVEAPMAGTFYRSPKPDEPPYVEEGDLVDAGDTVALVEVMKLYTELKAEASGKVARVDADDNSLVEFGRALIWIEPA